MNEGREGRFAVKITSKNGNVDASLTGEHFRKDEMCEAKIASAEDGKSSYVEGGSPVYLVCDSAVRLASGKFRKYMADVISKCHLGPMGRACGKCDMCKSAKSTAFTMLVMSSVDLQGGDLSERIFEAVGRTIGLTQVSACWNDPMTDEEVSKTFRKLEVKRTRAKKEKTK